MSKGYGQLTATMELMHIKKTVLDDIESIPNKSMVLIKYPFEISPESTILVDYNGEIHRCRTCTLYNVTPAIFNTMEV